VGAPELLAVQDEVVAVALGRRREAPGVGADVRLGQGERGDRARRAAREVRLLLMRRAEELEWLWHADRLMGREESADVAGAAPHPLHAVQISGDGEAGPAVLLGNLHAERAELAEAIHDLVRVFPGLVDRYGVHLGAEERLHLVVELRELRALLAQRKGV